MKVYLNLHKNSGVIYVEFIVGAVFLLSFLLGCIQLLYIYKGYLELEQATFEAARAGSVNNAQKAPMLAMLSDHLAELYSPGQTTASLARALATSRIDLEAQSQLNIRHDTIEILNPTLEAFSDWNIAPPGQPRRISNLWPTNQAPLIGRRSGVSQQDANLLKIQVTYAFEMKVPFINRVISRSLLFFFPINAQYYSINRIPLVTTATIHMQTDPIEDGNVSLDFFN